MASSDNSDDSRAEGPYDSIRPFVPRTDTQSTEQDPSNKHSPAIQGTEVEKPRPLPFHKIPAHFKFTYTWKLALVTFLFLVLTLMYAWATTTTAGPLTRLIPLSESNSLLVLRILTEITGLLLATLCGSGWTALLWGNANSQKGISLASFLALSSTTGFRGLVLLLGWKETSDGSSRHLLWIGKRFLFLLLFPFMGIIVMSQVSSLIVYTPLNYFPVSAGIGPFDASFADYSWQGATAISFAAVSTTLFIDAKQSFAVEPVTSECSSSANCQAYYYPGQLDYVTPSPFSLNNSQQAPYFQVQGGQGLQVDYWDVSTEEAPVTPDDCQVWASPIEGYSFGFAICIKTSSINPNNLIAAMSVCPSTNTACLNDTTWEQSVNLTTSLSFTRRTANTIYSSTSAAILSLTNLTTGTPEPTSPSSLFSVLDHFFTIPPGQNATTSTALETISWITIFQNQLLSDPAPFDKSRALDSLRAILTVPLLWFQANDISNVTISTSFLQDTPISGLPAELYVQGSFANVGSRILLAKWTVGVYMGVTGGLFLWCVGLLVWAIRIQVPSSSPYPLIDFGARVAAGEEVGEGVGVGRELVGISSGLDVKGGLQGKKVYLKTISREKIGGGHGEEKVKEELIGFSTDGNI